MPMVYDKLFSLLGQQGITTYQIRQQKIVTETTLQRLRHGGNVTTDAIGKFCDLLDCQPGDIMEWVRDDQGGGD